MKVLLIEFRISTEIPLAFAPFSRKNAKYPILFSLKRIHGGARKPIIPGEMRRRRSSGFEWRECFRINQRENVRRHQRHPMEKRRATRRKVSPRVQHWDSIFCPGPYVNDNPHADDFLVRCPTGRSCPSACCSTYRWIKRPSFPRDKLLLSNRERSKVRKSKDFFFLHKSSARRLFLRSRLLSLAASSPAPLFSSAPLLADDVAVAEGPGAAKLQTACL